MFLDAVLDAEKELICVARHVSVVSGVCDLNTVEIREGRAFLSLTFGPFLHTLYTSFGHLADA